MHSTCLGISSGILVTIVPQLSKIYKDQEDIVVAAKIASFNVNFSKDHHYPGQCFIKIASTSPSINSFFNHPFPKILDFDNSCYQKR